MWMWSKLRLGGEVVQYDKLAKAEKRFVETFPNLFASRVTSQYPTNLDVNAPLSQNPPNHPENSKIQLGRNATCI